MDAERVKHFFDAWSVYNRVLDHNYMFHDEIYGRVRDLVERRFGARPFAMLDLGCGSARHLGPALEGLNVARYTGYDLSDVALAHAAENLAALDGRVDLRRGDFLDGLRATDEPVDLVFCSFALHHLDAADKAAFFEAARRALRPDGLLLLIDTTREEDEDRDRYLDRYCAWLSSWAAIPAGDREAICEHVRGNDFPEKVSTLAAMAARAGLGRSAEVGRFGWHRVLAFEPSTIEPKRENER